MERKTQVAAQYLTSQMHRVGENKNTEHTQDKTPVSVVVGQVGGEQGGVEKHGGGAPPPYRRSLCPWLPDLETPHPLWVTHENLPAVDTYEGTGAVHCQAAFELCQWPKLHSFSRTTLMR